MSLTSIASDKTFSPTEAQRAVPALQQQAAELSPARQRVRCTHLHVPWRHRFAVSLLSRDSSPVQRYPCSPRRTPELTAVRRAAARRALSLPALTRGLGRADGQFYSNL